MLFTKCILAESSPDDGLRVSIMSRHTLDDGVTPDERLDGRCDIHMSILGPSGKLIGKYKRKEISWLEFELAYLDELRRAPKIRLVRLLTRFARIQNITTLCIGDTAEFCHRRVLAEECVRHEPRLRIGHR